MSKHFQKKWYNGHMLYRNVPDPYFLTLQTDGNGQISASKLSGYATEQINLYNTANDGYVFSAYTVTGASLNNSTLTLGHQDTTAKAWFGQKQNFVISGTSTISTGLPWRRDGVNITATTFGGGSPAALLRPLMTYKYVTAYPMLTTKKTWYINPITSYNDDVFTPTAVPECIFEASLWYELRHDGYNCNTTAALVIDDTVINSASGSVTTADGNHFRYTYLDEHNAGTAYNPRNDIRFEIYTDAPARLVSLNGNWRCSGYYIL